MTLEEEHKLKTELITAYHKAGYKNCIGSIEKLVNELFDLRDKMLKEESNKLVKLLLKYHNERNKSEE